MVRIEFGLMIVLVVGVQLLCVFLFFLYYSYVFSLMSYSVLDSVVGFDDSMLEYMPILFLKAEAMGRVKLRAVRPDGRSKDLSLTMNTTLQEVVAPWQQF